MKLAVISKNIKNPKSWLLIIALLYLLFRLFHAAIPEPKEFTSIYALDARASMFDVFGSVASYSAILAAFLYLAVPSKIERDGKLDFSSLNQTFLFFSVLYSFSVYGLRSWFIIPSHFECYDYCSHSSFTIAQEEEITRLIFYNFIFVFLVYVVSTYLALRASTTERN